MINSNTASATNNNKTLEKLTRKKKKKGTRAEINSKLGDPEYYWVGTKITKANFPQICTHRAIILSILNTTRLYYTVDNFNRPIVHM